MEVSLIEKSEEVKKKEWGWGEAVLFPTMGQAFYLYYFTTRKLLFSPSENKESKNRKDK